MYDEGLIKKIFYNAIRYLSPGTPQVQVIWMDQAERRVERPYIGLKMITGPESIGWDTVETSNLYEEVIEGVRELNFSVNCYGEKASSILANIKTQLQFQRVQANLLKNGLVFVSVSGIRDLTALLETRWETRAQMDIKVRFIEVQVDSGAEAIEQVELDNEITNTTTIVG